MHHMHDAYNALRMGSGHLFEVEPVGSSEIEERISKVYDHLYANASVRTPPQIAHEVGKLLHAALFVEQNKNVKPAFSFAKGELASLMRNETSLVASVAERIHKDFRAMNLAWQLYKKRDKPQLSAADLAFSAAQLSGISVSTLGRDIFGDALEVFRSQWAKRHGGQFFTDQRVTRLAMRLLRFDPWNGDDLVDICCGTGGFLLAGLHHMAATGTSRNGGSEVDLASTALKVLKGQEVDEEVRGIANAALASRIGTPDHVLVNPGNSLDPSAFAGANGDIRYDAHRCAASNPPFGTKITVKDNNILRYYELAAGERGLSPRPPDILFLEQNLRVLQPGIGRLAIVLPYQLLSGPQARYVRAWLLPRAQLVAVVDLPGETFQPHTGTKTCLLVVRRREHQLDQAGSETDPPVFMAMPRWIGHDRRGRPVYRREPDGSLTSEVLSDMEQVGDAYGAFADGLDPRSIHPDSFVVSPSSILTDSQLHLNALFHRPVSREKTRTSRGPRGRAVSWKTVRLGEVVERIFYPGRFKRHYVSSDEGGVPFLGGTNVSQLLITTDKYLASNDPRLHDLIVRTGWVLVTRSGSTGIVSLVPPSWDGWAMSEHVIRIVPNPDAMSGEYLFAFLRTRFAQDMISRGVFGSVIDEITPEFIGSLQMPVPKSRAVLKRVEERVRRGEQGRQQAIEDLAEASEELQTLLGSYS